MSDQNSNWTAKSEWMRAVGATDAAWSHDDMLLSIKLGPPPPEPDDTSTQPSISPLKREQLERERRRELATRSSGGPVRRLSDSD